MENCLTDKSPLDTWEAALTNPPLVFFIFGNKIAQVRNKLKGYLICGKHFQGKTFSGHEESSLDTPAGNSLPNDGKICVQIPKLFRWAPRMLFWQTRWIFRRISQKPSPKIMQQKLSQPIVPKVDYFFPTVSLDT